MQPNVNKTILCIVSILCFCCLISEINAQDVNKLPVAVITGATVRKLPSSSTRLYGRNSKDPDGKIIAYRWLKIAGPASFKMQGTDQENVYITMSVGTYTFQLTVTDNKGAKSSTTVTVTQYGYNKPPQAVVSGTTVITSPRMNTKLYADNSKDSDGNIVSYDWAYVSGPSTYKASGNKTNQLTVSNLSTGSYVFRLTVTDDNGAKSSTNVTVKKLSATNQDPVAVVTGQTSLIQPVNSTKLFALSSYDNDGSIASYEWKYISGPTSYQSTGASSSVFTLSNLNVGTYVFRLTVTDNEGGTADTTFTINQYRTGGSPGVGARIIITGLKTLTLPSNTTKLDASQTYDLNGGTITQYFWQYISGPKQYTLINSDKSILTLDNLTQGIYSFQFVATNDIGVMHSQIVSVEVKPTLPGAIACGCNKVLEPSDDDAIYLDGDRINAKPGDVFCIKAAHYRFINLKNFQGTSAKPITFKNCGGQVTLSGYSAYSIILSNSNYFKFTGTGNANYKYGFTATTATPGQFLGGPLVAGYLSSNFEIDHIETSWSHIGIFCKTQVTCDTLTWGPNYTMRNVKLHDIYSHNTLGEGFYIGYAAYVEPVTCNGVNYTVETQKIENLEVYNCRTNQTGWDGIQVASVPVNCNVHDNVVTNYGTANLNTQQFGIIFGGNCSGSVYNNVVENGTGAGINCLGKEKISIYNNLIYNVGYNISTYGQDGIFIDDRSQPGTPPVSLFIANNTIIHCRRNGITFFNSFKNIGPNNKFYNNLTVDPGSYNSFNGNYSLAGVHIGSKDVVVSASNNPVYGKISDAKFVYPDTLNFQITSASPAYNAGKDLTSYGLTTDILGVARPQDGVFDIGAYELNTSAGADRKRQTANTESQDVSNKIVVSKPGLTLSPVPAKDVLNVYLNNNYKGKLQLNIVDANGKTIAVHNNLYKDAANWHTTINVSQYISGMYYLHVITTGTEKANEKFVVIK